MRIASLKIQNFRGIRECSIRLDKHAVLIGNNNAGKTALIEALALLLGRDRLVRDLTEHDFYGSCPQPADRIKVVASVTGFASDDPEENSDWFRDGRAVVKWFDESKGTVHAVRRDKQWRLCCQIAVQARFDVYSLSTEIIRYFHDDDNLIDPFVEDSPVLVPARLIDQLGFYLVRASRTWDRVLSWGSELFRRTVHAAAAQPSVAILAERDRVRLPQSPIEADPQLEPLIKNVNQEIACCFPEAPSLRLRLTTTDSKAVMDAVSAHFTVAGGPTIPAGRQGSGLVSMQGLLLLLELGRVRAAAGNGFLMALEEPELHLPPATQQRLVHRIQALSTQTIVTTHSPVVAGIVEPTALMVLRNSNGELKAESFLAAPLPSTAPNWKRRFYQHSRVDVLGALMQPSVLVPEGKADFHLIRSILKPLMLTEGWLASLKRPFGVEVGVVPTEDAKVVETHSEMARLHERVSCLVDGDADGLLYAGALSRAQTRPFAVLRWHDGGMIEDVIGWLLMADERGVLGALQEVQTAPTSVAATVAYLKNHKVDIVAYEQVADAIAGSEACRKRAGALLGAMASVCTGVPPDECFVKDAQGVWVFQPRRCSSSTEERAAARP